MATKIPARKAPCIRILLIMGAFLLFIPPSHSQFDFNQNCQQAYQAVFSLNFPQAQKIISIEKRESPDNLIPVYLENYIDFLTLIIGEEQAVYDQLKNRMDGRITLLEKGRKDSPYYNFCLGQVYLQWAFARLKFGDYTTAAFEIHKAYDLFGANEKKYPDFLINRTGMGVLHVVVSLIPDNYRWVSSLIGIIGSMESGLKEIRQVADYSGSDHITMMYKQEAAFFLAFLVLNVQRDKTRAMQMLDLMKNQEGDDPLSPSPLMIFARATILMKNGLNDQAINVLHERTSGVQTFGFCYLDYLEGVARLNKLDHGASRFFEQFISGFRGRNYIRSAYQKLAWISLLQGDSLAYRKQLNLVLTKGASMVDEDKQAENEARQGVPPNVVLLRARLLFDGGYYDMAVNELLNNSVKIAVKSKRDLLEYTYRLGRIYHETGNLAKALENYRQTVIRGKTEPYYFAVSAAYQMGLLYESKEAYAKADSAYRLCLSIKSPEYKTSLHQKAKAGLNRLKKVNPKT